MRITLLTTMAKITLFFLMIIVIAPQSVVAQITNPALGELGGNIGNEGYTPDYAALESAMDGSMLLGQFVRYWGVAISIGALILLLMLVWSGLEWITAGGDKGKLEKARSRMLQSIIGMLVLATSFILISFVSGMLFGENFDLLNLNFYLPE